MIEYAILGGAIFGAGVITISSFKIFRIVPYAYSNAKIRALKSELISDNELKKYCQQDYNEIIYDISKKEGFKYFVELTKGELNIEAVEVALRNNLSRIMNKVYDLTPDFSKKVIKTMLMLDELKNIQTFLRYLQGLNQGNCVNIKLLNNLMTDTRDFSREEWIKLIKLPLNNFIKKFKNKPYYNILNNNIKQSSNKKTGYDFDLKKINRELDKFYFELVRKTANDETSREHAKTLIDIFNIRQLFAYKKFVPFRGGYLDNKFFENIDSFDKLKSSLLKTKYKTQLSNCKDEKEIEQRLDMILKNLGEKFIKKDPLSANSIIGFTILKRYEIKNLRLLLLLKNSGFSNEEIRTNLIINDF